MSRRLRYQVAVSLDGYIARKDGSYDWIVMDPAIDFERMYGEFDAAVMGRRTYDVVHGHEHEEMMGGMHCVVFSRTMPAQDRPRLRVTSDDPVAVVRQLKEQPGKDIWLYGGGELFGTLLKAGVVDTVEVAVIPVLLGDGVPLLPPGGETTLVLTDSKVLPESGILCLAYSVPGGIGPAPTVFYVKGA
jgi:dihydrofolate reductase